RCLRAELAGTWIARETRRKRIVKAHLEPRQTRQHERTAGKYRRLLYAGRARYPDRFFRQRQNGFPGDRLGQRRKTRDFQNSARPGESEVRRRLYLRSIYLEKCRHGRAGLSDRWKSSGNISIGES